MHRSDQTAQPAFCQQLLICLAGLLTGASAVCLLAQFSPLGASSTAHPAAVDGVLLDFTAKWCGPCQKMSPIVTRLEQQGYPVRKVDVDQERELAERYRIRTIPTFVLVVGGREVMRQSGETSESQLRHMLLKIPEYQRELARLEARPSERKVAETFDEATSPSPFGDSPADAAPPVATPENNSQSWLNLPWSKTKATGSTKSDLEPVAAFGPVTARGQTPDDAVLTSGAAASVHVRLRVKDQGGVNFGSGTIIDSRVGRSLVLTCGHLFRDLQPGAVVEVDVFERGRKPETLVGQVLEFDLSADVGLVAIPTSIVLPAAKLSSLNRSLQVSEKVVCVGCSGGELPTRDLLQVTALNKYDGPDNVECTGVPVRGRSGGGLFLGEELVGVCIAADPKEQRGLYCGLKPIYALLEQAGFAQLLPVGRPEPSPAVAAIPASTASEAGFSAAPVANAAAAATLNAAFEPISTEPAVPAAVPATATATDGSLAAALQASSDAEVICIVRPKNAQAPSRVVIVHQASPKLLSYLLDDAAPVAHRSLQPERKTDALIPTSVSTSASANREFQPRASAAPQRPLSPRAR